MTLSAMALTQDELANSLYTQGGLGSELRLRTLADLGLIPCAKRDAHRRPRSRRSGTPRRSSCRGYRARADERFYPPIHFLSRAAGIGDACVFAITEMQRKHEPKAYAGLAGIVEPARNCVPSLCTEASRATAALRLAVPEVEQVVRGLSYVFWECAKVWSARRTLSALSLISARLCVAGQTFGRRRAICDRSPWVASPSAHEDCRGVYKAFTLSNCLPLRARWGAGYSTRAQCYAARRDDILHCTENFGRSSWPSYRNLDWRVEVEVGLRDAEERDFAALSHHRVKYCRSGVAQCSTLPNQ